MQRTVLSFTFLVALSGCGRTSEVPPQSAPTDSAAPRPSIEAEVSQSEPSAIPTPSPSTPSPTPTHIPTLSLATPAPRPPAAPVPVDGVVTEEARWAFERLAPNHPEQRFLEALLTEVEASAKTGPQAEVAMRRVLAALRQLLDDQDNGRDQLQASPFWGQGASSARRELREKLVQLIRSRHGERPHERLAPVVAWLLFEEVDYRNIEQGLTMLERLPRASTKALHERILCEASPLREATRQALTALSAIPEPCLARVVALTAHPGTELAKLARRHTQAVSESYAPADALLDRLGDLVPFVLEGPLEVFSLTYEGQSRPVVHTGVVLSQTESRLEVGTLHGEVVRLYPKAPRVVLTRSATTLDALVAELEKARKTTDRDQRAAILSSDGMLSGQFAPGFISAVELMVAHALAKSGRRVDALAILTPRFAEVPDERWVAWAARDELARRLHEEMLVSWTLGRDTDEAVALATRLCHAAFEGYTYRARTCVLRDQLAQRKDDWRTFTLPSAAQWAELQKTLSRTEQLTYLAERVRLRNTRQWGQPGGVDFMDAQYDRALIDLDLVAWDERKAYEVLNPLVAIKTMNPTAEERSVLRPYTTSTALMAMYSYWRDFHPARELHTVGEAMSWLLTELERPSE
ncbi:MAG TPA: hypothetical protein PK095_09785 [Myxococcota bacterium]|nr:hypothetical protein [Myxococcota bacterium]